MPTSKVVPRFCIYVRKSTEEKQYLSIPSQIQELQEFAKNHGIEILKLFRDEGSAKKPNNRPGFDAMIKAIKKGEINSILTWKPNRIARNMIEGGLVIELWQQGVINLIRTPFQLYRSGDNILTLSVEFSMANQEVKDLIDNIKRGNRTKVKLGGFLSMAPVGYLNARDGKKKFIIPDPERFDIMKRLFRLYLKQNYSLRALCDTANAYGFKTRKRGLPMTTAALYRILRNPFYAGIIRQSGLETKGNHKAMITKAEHYEIVYNLTGYKLPNTKYSFPYRCFIKCGESGNTLTPEEKYRYNCPQCNKKHTAKNPKKCKCGYYLTEKDISKAKRYLYYHCTTKPKRGRPYFKKEVIDQQFEEIVCKYSIESEFLHWCYEWIDFASKSDLYEREELLIELDKNISKARKKIDRLTDLRAEGELEKEEYLTRKNSLKDELVGLEIKKDSFDAVKAPDLKVSYEFLKGLTRKFKKSDDLGRDRILRIICSNPTLTDGLLSVEPGKPYLYLQEFKRLHRGGIEPPKNQSMTGMNEAQKECYSLWCTTYNKIRTPNKD